jgi:hypothetical protein
MPNRNPSKAIEEFERLVRLAAAETVPPLDVTDSVLRRLRMQQVSLERPLLVMAFGAAVAAITLAMLSYPMLQNMMDPLQNFMETATASLL